MTKWNYEILIDFARTFYLRLENGKILPWKHLVFNVFTGGQSVYQLTISN